MQEILIAWLTKKDALGSSNNSSAMLNAIYHIKHLDTWNILKKEVEFTYVTSNKVSAIDRINISNNLKEAVRSVNIQSVAFSDHRAYVIRIAIPNDGKDNVYRVRLWSYKTRLTTSDIINEFKENWAKWTRYKKNYNKWID